MSYGESPGQRTEERTRELMNLPEHMIMQSLRAEVDSTLEFPDVGSYHLSGGMQVQGRAIEMRKWLFTTCLVFHRRVLHTHALSPNVRKPYAVPRSRFRCNPCIWLIFPTSCDLPPKLPSDALLKISTGSGLLPRRSKREKSVSLPD